MNRWLGDLKYDPLAPLLECGNAAIQTFVRCDLLDKVVSVKDLWQLAEPQKILQKQKLTILQQPITMLKLKIKMKIILLKKDRAVLLDYCCSVLF